MRGLEMWKPIAFQVDLPLFEIVQLHNNQGSLWDVLARFVYYCFDFLACILAGLSTAQAGQANDTSGVPSTGELESRGTIWVCCPTLCPSWLQDPML